jgi:hypothetical protein
MRQTVLGEKYKLRHNLKGILKRFEGPGLCSGAALLKGSLVGSRADSPGRARRRKIPFGKSIFLFFFLFAIERERRSPPFSPPTLKNTPVGCFSTSASKPPKLISLLTL